MPDSKRDGSERSNKKSSSNPETPPDDRSRTSPTESTSSEISPGGSFRAWAEETRPPASAPAAQERLQPEIGPDGEANPPLTPEALQGTTEALLNLLHMSQGFANTGAREVERLHGLLKNHIEAGKNLLESNRQVLSEIKSEQEALLEECRAAVGERKALQEARKKTREAGQQMREDFLEGLDNQAQKVGKEQINAINSGSVDAAGRVMEAIEDQLGTAVETATKTTTDVAKSTSGVMEDLEKAARKARRKAAQAAWKPTTVAILTSISISVLLVMGITWMRPGWSQTSNQKRALAIGQRVSDRYDILQGEIQGSLNRIEKLQEPRVWGSDPLTPAERKATLEKVLSRQEMQGRLAQIETIREVIGWRTTEYLKNMAQQVKAFEGKGSLKSNRENERSGFYD